MTIHVDHLDACKKAARENIMEIKIIAAEGGSYPRLSPIFGTEKVPRGHMGIEVSGSSQRLKIFLGCVKKLLSKNNR